MGDEPLEGSHERSADRWVSGERDLSAWCKDAIPIVCRGVRRREDERGFGEIHLPSDRLHLHGRQTGRTMEYGERVPRERGVRENVHSPEIEETLRHDGAFAARMAVRVLNARPTGFCARRPSGARGTAIATTGSHGRHDFAIRDRRIADRVQKFPESVIREMTRIAALNGAVNLAQG